jgi:hypothetical protein
MKEKRFGKLNEKNESKRKERDKLNSSKQMLKLRRRD